MIHLAYVCEDRGIALDGCKGACVHVRSMITAFAELGTFVTVFSPRIGDRSWASELPVQFVDLHATIDPALEFQHNPVSGQSEVGERLSALHTEMPFQAVYERLSLWANSSSRWCRENRVPHGLEVNSPLTQEAAIHRSLQDVETAQAVEREVLLNADRLFPVSPWLCRWLKSQGCEESRIQYLPNGIKESWLKREGLIHDRIPLQKQSPVTIGFVGSLRPWHDLETLLEAIGTLPEQAFHLLLIGDGPLRSWLQDILRERMLRNRATWLGAVATNAIPAQIDQMDICVAPYRPLEDFYFCPIKIFEYGARRRPVVTADLPELREQFPGDSMSFYEGGNPESLAEIVNALVASPELALRQATKLWEYVSEHTWINHAKIALNSLERSALADSKEQVH